MLPVSTWAEPEATARETRVKNRRKHLGNGLLNNAINDCGYASGVSAKFAPIEQKIESPEITTNTTSALPNHSTKDQVIKRHNEMTTEYTKWLKQRAKQHLDSFDMKNEEKVDLLLTETSLLQAGTEYIEVNKVLFRSQYNLLESQFYPDKIVTQFNINDYFSELREKDPEGFGPWDSLKYMSYLIEAGLIQAGGSGYILTMFGSSYISFMKKSINLVDRLIKL